MAVLVKGDGGSKIHVTITNADDQQLVDLSGKSATLCYNIAGGTIIKRAMSVLSQTTSKGEAEYQLTTTDLNVSGEFEAEVIINDGQSDQLTTEKFRLKIRESKG